MKALLAAFSITFPVLAVQAAGPTAPDAGSLLQQIQPVTIPPPSSTATGLTVEGSGQGNTPPSTLFMVKNIRISGNTLFATAVLHALVADAEGKSLTLANLEERAARITNYYHRHGYVLARALIPAQVIREGVVVIEVAEARYGAIRLDNRSRVRTAILQDTLAPLESGQAIGQADLDRALLLLADIPGVGVNATLRAGETFGTSDLLVNATADPLISGSMVLDDYGNPYTGRVLFSGTVNVIDPLHLGDILSLSGLSSGRGINYGRIAYESVVDGEGTHFGGSYSTLHYIVGGPLASLNANGTAQVESLWAKQTLVRSRNFNLYAQIQYDQMQLSDQVDAGAIQTDRQLENWTVSLAGDARDTYLSRGVTIWRFDWTEGRDRFSNLEAELADAATARTQDGFSKLSASLCRLQSLSSKDELYLSFYGQWANGNLDSSEKMIAGGPTSVRAYDMGAISADVGYLETAELRHDLGSALSSQWQAVAFYDSAQVTVNKTTWTGGPNSANLSGAGIGLNCEGPRQWSAKVSVAERIGPVPAPMASAASARIWIEFSKGF